MSHRHSQGAQAQAPAPAPAPAPPLPMDHQLRDFRLRHSYELMHKNLLKSMNAYAVVLSILVTISYSGFLQPPKPLHLADDNGPNSSSFQKLFFYFNGFSFFSSVCGLLFFASSSFSPLLVLDSSGSVTPLEEVAKRIKLLAVTLVKFVFINFFFAMSLTSCVASYIFAGLATVSSKKTEQLAVIITSVIGGFIYMQALMVCFLDVSQLWQGGLRRHKQLWEALKKETIFGQWFTQYLELLCRESPVSHEPNENQIAANEEQHRREEQYMNGNAGNVAP